MHEGGAVHQLDRRRRRIGDPRLIIAARLGHRETEGGANPRAAGKNRVSDSRREPGRRSVAFDSCNQGFEGSFDARL